MTDKPIQSDFDEELLSAYVDGEVSEQQRAEIESLLEQNPQAQQLVDELQSLSTTLRSLPPVAVGEDLRDLVLARAERAMLVGEPGGQPSVTLPPEYSRKPSLRRWVGPTVAIAATLVLALFLPSGEDSEQASLERRAREAQPVSAPQEPEPSSQLQSNAQPSPTELNVELIAADQDDAWQTLQQLVADHNAQTDQEQSTITLVLSRQQAEQVLATLHGDVEHFKALQIEGEAEGFDQWQSLNRQNETGLSSDARIRSSGEADDSSVRLNLKLRTSSQ